MRKANVVLWGVIFSLGILVSTANAADKFGYVDLSRIFSEYGKAKTFEKTLNDKLKVYTDERDKKVADLKALQDKLSLLNDKEREARGAELQAKVEAFQEYDNQKKVELRKEEEEKTREIFNEIEATVKQYSEKEAYTMVFNDRVLVYQAKTLDITDKIIDILNKDKK